MLRNVSATFHMVCLKGQMTESRTSLTSWGVMLRKEWPLHPKGEHLQNSILYNSHGLDQGLFSYWFTIMSEIILFWIFRNENEEYHKGANDGQKREVLEIYLIALVTFTIITLNTLTIHTYPDRSFKVETHKVDKEPYMLSRSSWGCFRDGRHLSLNAENRKLNIVEFKSTTLRWEISINTWLKCHSTNNSNY